MRLLKNKLFWVLASAFLFRLISLNQSLWLDEGTTTLVARDLTWHQFLVNFLPGDFHPPLYYITVKLFTSLIGNYSEVALRTPSVVFALVAIALVYKIAKKSKTPSALVSAILIATAPLHVYYSQEARMYQMAAMFVALAVYFYIERNYMLFTISLAASFWADYMTIFMLPVFLLDKKSVKATLLSVALCIPMLLFLPNQLSTGLSIEESWARALGETNIKNALLIPVKFLIGRVGFENSFVYAGVVLSMGALAIYLIRGSFGESRKYKIFWLWLILPVFLALIVGLFIPIVSYFRLLFALPAFYLLISFSKSKLVYLLVVTNILFTVIYLFTPKFHREDWRGAVSFIELEAQGVSQVIFPANTQMEGYNYYAKNDNFSGPDNIRANSEEIWLIRYVYDIVDSEDTTKAKVEELGFEKVNEYNFNGVLVWRYQ